MTLPVVYTEKMVGNVASFSPSSGKPKLVVEQWLADKKDIAIVEGRAATINELAAAHSTRYIDGILDGTIINGFSTKDVTLADTFKYTVGAMLTAVDLVHAGHNVVCAPTSGFHHAGYQNACGFCTFNGLVVASEYFKDGEEQIDTEHTSCQHYMSRVLSITNCLRKGRNYYE